MTDTNDREQREKSTDGMQEHITRTEGFATQDKKSTAGPDGQRSRQGGAEEELDSADRKPTRQTTGGPAKPTA